MKSSVLHPLLLFLLLSYFTSEAYKPVIIVHGLFDGPKQFKTLTGFIQKAHPGTEVTALDMFDDLFSLRPLWTQVKSFRSALESRLNRTKDGAHLICFSQGGVICRALLSVIQNHNIHSFIALSSPLAGQYGGLKSGLSKVRFTVCLVGLSHPEEAIRYRSYYWSQLL
uniref:Lysosomal thioesterase PPT2 n=1 Tax=Neogobius melanostomus TaxID=47308 RepID=A0A8C6ULE1_9GOBI